MCAPTKSVLSWGFILVLTTTACGCGDDGTTEPEGDLPGVDTPSADADVGVGGEADTGPPPCAPGTACDDDDVCTTGDACDATGACVGTPLDCDDDLFCTNDGCSEGECTHELQQGHCISATGACVPDNLKDPDNACVICYATGPDSNWINTPSGTVCDDGDACTTGDSCHEGVCAGPSQLLCTPPGPCWEVDCDTTVGCVETPIEAGEACDDGDACTAEDQCDAAGACLGAAPLDCDDGDACTSDACHPVAGCMYTADVCDDGDPCTDDSCAAGGACTNAAFEGPCEDGDLCTGGEVCDAAGVCGGGTAVECDDQNDCTDDSCDPATGCVYAFNEMPCDDGNDCTFEDGCVAGECLGMKLGCEECPVPGSDSGQKLTEFALGLDGKPGSGLDVDGDPTTCQPQGDCTLGIDNNLAILAPVINDGILQSLQTAQLAYVADLEPATFDGEPFELVLHFVDLAESNPDCSVQTEPCDWVVSQYLFDPECVPYFHFEDTTIVDGFLTAGGTDTVITIVIPLSAMVSVPLTIGAAQIEAELSFDPVTKEVASIDGLIGGAVMKSQLIDAIMNTEEGVLPFDKEAIAGLLEGLIDNDIDLDGDGDLDAASIGFAISTIPGKLVTP